MRRLHLCEFHDLEWCPKARRDRLTDFLQFPIEKFDLYGPAIPLLITFDGIVSYLRTYTIDELREMAGTAEGYQWVAGKVGGGRSPARVTYFIGYPAQQLG